VPPSSPIDIQRQALRLYGELVCRSPALGGKLVFACGEGTASTGLAAAASIAGAASLLVDPDPAAVKAVLRQGGVDFVVNTLDEALRILKNEVRKHSPVSVALPANPAAVLAEILERGVLPDFHVAILPAAPIDKDLTAGLLRLQRAGMVRIRLERRTEIHSTMLASSNQLEKWLNKKGWQETSLPPNTVVRAENQRLLDELPPEDTIRRRWLERAPQYLRAARNGVQWTWL
jgi:urocanate hydratase